MDQSMPWFSDFMQVKDPRAVEYLANVLEAEGCARLAIVYRARLEGHTYKRVGVLVGVSQTRAQLLFQQACCELAKIAGRYRWYTGEMTRMERRAMAATINGIRRELGNDG